MAQTAIKSIYLNYIIQGLTPSKGQDMMNSSFPRTGTKMQNFVSFSFSIEGSSVPMTIQFPKFEAKETPITDWLGRFQALATDLRWDERSKLLVLKSLLPLELRELVDLKISYEACEAALLSDAFPPEKTAEYYKIVITTKQQHFETIKAYSQAFQERFAQYCFARQLKPKEQSIQVEEMWMQGLHPRTMLEMSKLGLTTKNEIERRVQAVEKAILELPSEQSSPSQTLHNGPKKKQNTSWKRKI